MPYDHRSIEPKWQARWTEAGLHKTPFDPTRPKFYALDMFPYPSGAGLHVGHCEGYTATDIITRWKRMQGFNVLHPMGWDAFGLPAENYAIKTGIHPRETTYTAIANFRRQIDSVGFAYDWDREVNTTDPAYFKWTQWIFLQLFKMGLAYQSEIAVNWCPALGTVLANEEVIGGKSEVGGHPVVRQPLRQWMLKITAYADRLLSDLEHVDWPDSTLAMQRNWIGRSEGAEVVFKVDGLDEALRVFTTRPDTLAGATYMVLAPEHALVARLTTPEQATQVQAYQDAARSKSDLERTELTKVKTGAFTGGFAINPVNGERIPIWIADYVLAGYGTGAIMAVPAHDERDHAFATKYGLPIKQVVAPADGQAIDLSVAYTAEGVAVHSGPLDGLPTPEAKREMIKRLEAQGQGKGAVTYRLRDWVFSRQRYWGEPIPIYFPVKTDGDPRQGAAFEIDYSQPIAVDEAELPLRLPEIDDYRPGDPQGALVKAVDWRFFQKDGQWFARETNTMPQWAGSCWYYLRYIDAQNSHEIFSSEKEKYWGPVDLYVGGAEHAVLHLLYARFWHKVLYDLGKVSSLEPFKKLRHQGTVLAFTYQDQGEHYHPIENIDLRPEGAFLKSTGEAVKVTVEKMAKSRLNGVNPDDVVNEYGADVLRLYEMFMGEFELPKPWDARAIEGCSRFLRRLWRLVEEWKPETAPQDDPHLRLRHKTIKRVTADLDRMQFNTAVAAMMEYVNGLTGKGATREDLITLVKLVGPYAPHVGDEAWQALGEKGFLIEQPWPTFDDALTIDDVVTMAIQVNGKMRGSIDVPRTIAKEEAERLALQQPNVQKHIEGKEVRKVVVVPGKIVNIVVA
ncbi:MAG: leucine--tRNA ligase [Deltaproteobacteria bacterium]|nr:leucine--tRNA ligase [Deltaproteobacteria bacterium]